MLNGLAMTVLTDGQTNRTDFITSTADAGGKNNGKKNHKSVAAPPVCRTYLCSRAYFMILRMCMRKICVRMHEVLRTHAHEILMSL